MHQVEVDVVGLQLLQLLVQQRLHFRPVVHVLRGHLGGDGDPVPVAVLQRLAQHDLRRAVEVDVGRVQVGHAAVHGAADQGDGLLLVDDAVAGGRAVEAHAAQAEGRALDAQLAEVAVFHDGFLL